jgi:hypothetical protein
VVPPPARAAEPEAPRAPAEYEFSDEHKEVIRSLAASISFVGVCTMLFGIMSAVFAVGAMYSGFGANGAGLLVGAAVFVVTAWWTMSAGRSLSSMVTTRGKDVQRLMEAMRDLRRLYGFARVFVILAAVALVAIAAGIVWCSFLTEKGGVCPVGWW